MRIKGNTIFCHRHLYTAGNLMILLLLCMLLCGAGRQETAGPAGTNAAAGQSSSKQSSSEQSSSGQSSSGQSSSAKASEAEQAQPGLRLPIAIREGEEAAAVQYDPEKGILELLHPFPHWYGFLADRNTEALLLPMEESYAVLQQALFYANSSLITSGLVHGLRLPDGENDHCTLLFALDTQGRLKKAADSRGRELHYYYNGDKLSQIFLKENGQLLQYAELFWSEDSDVSEPAVKELLFIDSSGPSSVREKLAFSRTDTGVITALTVTSVSGIPSPDGQPNTETAEIPADSAADPGSAGQSDAETTEEYLYQHNEDGTIRSILRRTGSQAFSRYSHDEYGNLLCLEDTIFSYTSASDLSSKSSTAPSEDGAAASLPVTEQVTFDRGYIGGNEYAFILGRSSDGNVTWRRDTALYPTDEVSQTGEIGCYADQAFYYYEGGSIYALDMQSGNLLWRNDQFGGGSAVSAIGPDGTIYICGYYGPSFLAVSAQGYVIFNSYHLGYALLWPSSMEYDLEKDLVYVTMEADMSNDGSPTVCIIDPHTFNCTFQ